MSRDIFAHKGKPSSFSSQLSSSSYVSSCSFLEPEGNRSRRQEPLISRVEEGALRRLRAIW